MCLLFTECMCVSRLDVLHPVHPGITCYERWRHNGINCGVRACTWQRLCGTSSSQIWSNSTALQVLALVGAQDMSSAWMCRLPRLHPPDEVLLMRSQQLICVLVCNEMIFSS